MYRQRTHISAHLYSLHSSLPCSLSGMTLPHLLTRKQECNVILARTHEYRPPTTSAGISAANSALILDEATDTLKTLETVKLNMTSRFLGLVVVPGQHITRIEVEEKLQVGEQDKETESGAASVI